MLLSCTWPLSPPLVHVEEIVYVQGHVQMVGDARQFQLRSVLLDVRLGVDVMGGRAMASAMMGFFWYGLHCCGGEMRGQRTGQLWYSW